MANDLTISVKSLRAKMNLSQAEFAARFGFNLGELRHWERGRRIPGRAASILLAAITDMPDVIERAAAKLKRAS
jgi:putative transcriptional regulator